MQGVCIKESLSIITYPSKWITLKKLRQIINYGGRGFQEETASLGKKSFHISRWRSAKSKNTWTTKKRKQINDQWTYEKLKFYNQKKMKIRKTS